MKILQVDYSDLLGQIYNGFDLQRSLNKKGHQAKQVVLDKLSDDENVIPLQKDQVLHEEMKYLEKKLSISQMLFPYGREIVNMKEYQEADIVHFHILHLDMVSLLDLPLLMNSKHAVWTIHDPWIVTGNCAYPLQCEKWRTGCGECGNLDYKGFEMHEDNTHFMWEIKKKVFKQINPTIVVASDFTRKYIEESPLTNHFTDIVKIPFGVHLEEIGKMDRRASREEMMLGEKDFVIGFRIEFGVRKGCGLLYEALRRLDDKENVVLMTVGTGNIPKHIKEKFRIIELGQVNDETRMMKFFKACDVFIMPSLAETFGLMAVEAMAASVPVICFKDTVLEEVSFAPECGVTAAYGNIEELKEAVCSVRQNVSEARRRGRLGSILAEQHYSYEAYVKKHIQLYERLSG